MTSQAKEIFSLSSGKEIDAEVIGHQDNDVKEDEGRDDVFVTSDDPGDRFGHTRWHYSHGSIVEWKLWSLISQHKLGT